MTKPRFTYHAYIELTFSMIELALLEHLAAHSEDPRCRYAVIEGGRINFLAEMCRVARYPSITLSFSTADLYLFKLALDASTDPRALAPEEKPLKEKVETAYHALVMELNRINESLPPTKEDPK